MTAVVARENAEVVGGLRWLMRRRAPRAVAELEMTRPIRSARRAARNDPAPIPCERIDASPNGLGETMTAGRRRRGATRPRRHGERAVGPRRDARARHPGGVKAEQDGRVPGSSSITARQASHWTSSRGKAVRARAPRSQPTRQSRHVCSASTRWCAARTSWKPRLAQFASRRSASTTLRDRRRSRLRKSKLAAGRRPQRRVPQATTRRGENRLCAGFDGCERLTGEHADGAASRTAHPRRRRTTKREGDVDQAIAEATGETLQSPAW